MSKINFGYSDRMRLSREVLKNGDMAGWVMVVSVGIYLPLVFKTLQGVRVGPSWWRVLCEQNPGDGQETLNVVELCGWW